MSKDFIKFEFEALLKRMREEMSLSEKFKFLYDKEGKEYNNIYDVCNAGKTVLISSLPNFRGVR
jgi:hypothetical protein